MVDGLGYWRFSKEATGSWFIGIVYGIAAHPLMLYLWGFYRLSEGGNGG